MEERNIHAYRLPFELILRDSFMLRYKIVFCHIHLSLALNWRCKWSLATEYIHYIIKSVNSSSYFFEEAKDVILWTRENEKRGHQMVQVMAMFQAYGKCNAHIIARILWHEILFYFVCFVIHSPEHWKMRYK